MSTLSNPSIYERILSEYNSSFEKLITDYSTNIHSLSSLESSIASTTTEINNNINILDNKTTILDDQITIEKQKQKKLKSELFEKQSTIVGAKDMDTDTNILLYTQYLINISNIIGIILISIVLYKIK